MNNLSLFCDNFFLFILISIVLIILYIFYIVIF